MSLHDRTWRYIPAATHATSEAFRDRQRARLHAASEARRQQQEREQVGIIPQRATLMPYTDPED